MTRSLLTGTCGLALLVLSAGGLQARQQPASQMTPAASQRTPAASAGQPADASQIDDEDLGMGGAGGCAAWWSLIDGAAVGVVTRGLGSTIADAVWDALAPG